MELKYSKMAELVTSWEQDMDLSDQSEGEIVQFDSFDRILLSDRSNITAPASKIKEKLIMHPSSSWNTSEDYSYQNGVSGLRNHYLPNVSNYWHNDSENNLDHDPNDENQIYEVLRNVSEDFESGKLDCYFLNNAKENNIEENKELNFKETQVVTRQEKLSEEDDYNSDEFEEGDAPDWYNQMLQQKKKEMEYRLQYLGNAARCEGSREHVKRQVEDHGTVYCRYDTPKHPSFKKAWTNIWKFSCTAKCKFEGMVHNNHEHSGQCRQYLLQDKMRQVSCESNNLLEIEYPKFVMIIVQDFQDFINGNCQQPSCCYNHRNDKKYEQEIQYQDLLIKTNHKKEVVLTIEGIGVEGYEQGKLNKHLSVVKKMFNIVLIYKVRRSIKNPTPILISGSTTLQHRVNSDIALPFIHKPLLFVNIVEIDLLKKTLIQVLQLSPETVLVDIGCGVGLISNLLAPKCHKVIGLDTSSGYVKQAEDISKDNYIYNTSFIETKPVELFQKLSAFCKQRKTVVILKQDSVYGKNKTAIRDLKRLPSVCQIVMWGPFTAPKDIVPTVCVLTQKEDDELIPFYPKSACMLDKSPQNKDDFHIVLVFERESIVIDSKPSELDVILKKEEKAKFKSLINVKSGLVRDDVGFHRTVVHNNQPTSFQLPKFENKEENQSPISEAQEDPIVENPIVENPLAVSDHYKEEYKEFPNFITGSGVDHKPDEEILEYKQSWSIFTSEAKMFDISDLETPVVNHSVSQQLPSTSRIQTHAKFSIDTKQSFIPKGEPIDSDSSESDYEKKPKIKKEIIIKNEKEVDEADLFSEKARIEKELREYDRKDGGKKRRRCDRQDYRDREKRRERGLSYDKKKRDRYYVRDRYDLPLYSDRRYRSRSRSPTRYSSRPSYAKRSRSRERSSRRTSDEYKRNDRKRNSRELS